MSDRRLSSTVAMYSAGVSTFSCPFIVVLRGSLVPGPAATRRSLHRVSVSLAHRSVIGTYVRVVELGGTEFRKLQALASHLWGPTAWWHPGGLAWQLATEHDGTAREIRIWGDAEPHTGGGCTSPMC